MTKQTPHYHGHRERLRRRVLDKGVESLTDLEVLEYLRLYANKRAEMWGELRDWLDDKAGVDIPDDDTLHTDLCAPIWGKGATRFNSNQQIVLEPKDRIKERLGCSPDGGDAAALTFAQPVHNPPQRKKRYEPKTEAGRTSHWSY